MPATLGISVRPPGRCRCGAELATIDTDTTGQHAAALRCVECFAPRGWLSHTTFDFVTSTIRLFGAPAIPIIIRRGAIR
jgi:hypothetical protein